MTNRPRLLERFLRYVVIDTTANDNTQDYPSSPGQRVLGELLVGELKAMGAADARQDEWGLVTATVPATASSSSPAIVLCAHLDTSPETTGAGVKPQVIEDYAGGDITLPGDVSQVIRESKNPQLAKLRGATLITTDGTTLLGADDKAGVAVIMEAAERMLSDPEHVHGEVHILFTCDEEIGRGVDHVDVPAVGAIAAYTLDGPGADQIDVETFSADVARVTVRGVNIHPSIAKDRMVNAVRGAAEFVSRLPRKRLSPETTEGREGFLHPYQISGGVARTDIRILLRDFDTPQLEAYAALLRRIADEVEVLLPGLQLETEIKRQYRNLADGLRGEPRAVGLARQAHENLGRTPRLEIIRGGTDGSLLTEKGLPTPNLSTGQHNPHSPLEWACLEEMEQAVAVLLELARLWGQEA